MSMSLFIDWQFSPAQDNWRHGAEDFALSLAKFIEVRHAQDRARFDAIRNWMRAFVQESIVQPFVQGIVRRAVVPRRRRYMHTRKRALRKHRYQGKPQL